MKNKKYIVYKNYTFGRNYYNAKLQVVPDYQIADNIPVVDYNTMAILIERDPYLQVEIAK